MGPPVVLAELHGRSASHLRTNVEVHDGTLGLGTPVALGGHLERAEGVALLAELLGHDGRGGEGPGGLGEGTELGELVECWETELWELVKVVGVEEEWEGVKDECGDVEVV